VGRQGLRRRHRRYQAACDGASAGFFRGRDGVGAAGIHLPTRLDHDLHLGGLGGAGRRWPSWDGVASAKAMGARRAVTQAEQLPFFGIINSVRLEGLLSSHSAPHPEWRNANPDATEIA
jgi:hypothetical protein